jgi:hypothetical protein
MTAHRRSGAGARGDPAGRSRIRFQTEMGSVYEVTRDSAGMHWQRLSVTLASGQLGSEGGPLATWPDVRVGEHCEMEGEPVRPPFLRLVSTSRVVVILEGESAIAGPDPAAGPESFDSGVRKHRNLLLPEGWPSFLDINPGDKVTRIIGGYAMQLRVSAVDERFIYCGDPRAGWKFARDTGIEVDEELGWGPPPALVGTYLVPAVLDVETREN